MRDKPKRKSNIGEFSFRGILQPTTHSIRAGGEYTLSRYLSRYLSMYVSIYRHTHTHVYAYIIYIYINTNKYMHTCIYMHIYVYRERCKHTHTHTHIYIYMYMYIYLYVSVYIYVYIYTYIYIYIQFILRPTPMESSPLPYFCSVSYRAPEVLLGLPSGIIRLHLHLLLTPLCLLLTPFLRCPQSRSCRDSFSYRE